MATMLATILDDARKRADDQVSAFRRSVGANSSPGSLLIGGGGAAPSGAGGMVGNLFQSSSLASHKQQLDRYRGWVHACVRIIGQRIAGQPIRVGRMAKRRGNGGDRNGNRRRGRSLPSWLKNASTSADIEILEDHELLDILADPNPLMVCWGLMFVTIVQLELTGRSYWWLRSPSDETKATRFGPEVWPMPPSWVEQINDGKFRSAWKVTPEGASQSWTVPGDEIVYFYYPDPSSPFSASSTLQAQARAVATDESMSDAQHRLFQNSIFPGLGIVVGRHPDVSGGKGERPHLTAEQRRQIVTWVKQFYRGTVHYGEPLIMDGLIENIIKLTHTSPEMGFLDSGKITKERICQGFGVNPVMLGQVEGANRASAVVADEIFVSTTINPKIELLSQCMTAWLGPMFAHSGEKLIVWIEPACTNDPEITLKEDETIFKGGLRSFNEWRARYNLPAVDGMDDVYVTPQGLAPRRPEDIQTLLSDDMASDTDDLTESEESGESNDLEKHINALWPDTLAKRARLSDLVSVYLESYSKEVQLFTDDLAATFRTLGSEVMSEVTRFAGFGVSVIDNLSGVLTDWSGWGKRLLGIAAPHVRRMARTGGQDEWDGFRAGRPGFTGNLPAAFEQAVNRFADEILKQPYWLDLAPSVRSDVARAIKSAVIAGKDPKALIEDLKVVLGPDASEARAKTIAKTEATGAIGAGHTAVNDELKKLGYIRKSQWNATFHNTRDSHAGAHGQFAESDGTFWVGGYRCRYPGDTSLPVSERVNCACFITSVTVEKQEGG